MPTGYTAILYDADENTEITLNEFVWACARAMTPLMCMRDAPARAPIPDVIEPNSYYDEQLADARERLRHAEAMTMAEIVQHVAALNTKAEADWKAARIRMDRLAARYKKMIANVETWEPPTPNHGALKSYMLEQLRSSLDFDVLAPDNMPPPKPISAESYLASEVASAQRAIEDHSSEREKDIAQTHRFNAWLDALRSSVGPPPKTR